MAISHCQLYTQVYAALAGASNASWMLSTPATVTATAVELGPSAARARCGTGLQLQLGSSESDLNLRELALLESAEEVGKDRHGPAGASRQDVEAFDAAVHQIFNAFGGSKSSGDASATSDTSDTCPNDASDRGFALEMQVRWCLNSLLGQCVHAVEESKNRDMLQQRERLARSQRAWQQRATVARMALEAELEERRAEVERSLEDRVVAVEARERSLNARERAQTEAERELRERQFKLESSERALAAREAAHQDHKRAWAAGPWRAHAKEVLANQVASKQLGAPSVAGDLRRPPTPSVPGPRFQRPSASPATLASHKQIGSPALASETAIHYKAESRAAAEEAVVVAAAAGRHLQESMVGGRAAAEEAVVVAAAAGRQLQESMVAQHLSESEALAVAALMEEEDATLDSLTNASLFQRLTAPFKGSSWSRGTAAATP